jgi:hypothetical protein
MLHPQEEVRHFSRRAVLKSLAGSAAGLGLLGLAPATAFARGRASAASVPLKRGQTLYRVYYYTQGIVFGSVSAFLATSLAKSSVRDACYKQRESTSASNLLQRT